MGPFEPDLIKALKNHNADRQHGTDGHIHPAKPIPPATAENLRKTEQVLGFQMPELLRTLYREVGNGGFGPE